MYWCHVPEVEGMWAPAIHSNCIHNEHRALVMRTMGPTPPFVRNVYLTRVFASFRRLARRMELAPWDYEHVVASYTGRMRERYEEARQSLIRDGELVKGDKRLKSFVKGEKFNPHAKESKPRLINARSPRYNLSLATFLKPLEAAFWRRLKTRCKGVARTRVVGKGLNGRQRARLVVEKMGNVGAGCVVFEVDGKQFEAHVNREELAMEHSVYLSAYDNDPELRAMLSCQLDLKGVTSFGIKYERYGCRASGDFNTGLGNTMIMLGATYAAMDLLQAQGFDKRWDVLCDGDNCLMFVEPAGYRELHTRFDWAVQQVSGQELTVESPVDIVEQVVFGQSQPVKVNGSYVMVRNVHKVLSNSFSSYRHYKDYARFGVRLLKSVAECELALAQGVPLLQPYFAAAVRKLHHVPDLQRASDYLEPRLQAVLRSLGETSIHRTIDKLGPIEDEARISFAKAFGIGVEQQLDMEERLVRGLKFPHEESMLAQVWTRLGFNWVSWEPIDVVDRPVAESVPHQDAVFLSATY